MNNTEERTTNLFETCIGCGAAISIKVDGDDHCPNCVGINARFDALVNLVVDFGKSLEKQGYESIEVRDALEFAKAEYEIKKIKSEPTATV